MTRRETTAELARRHAFHAFYFITYTRRRRLASVPLLKLYPNNGDLAGLQMCPVAHVAVKRTYHCAGGGVNDFDNFIVHSFHLLVNLANWGRGYRPVCYFETRILTDGSPSLRNDSNSG